MWEDKEYAQAMTWNTSVKRFFRRELTKWNISREIRALVRPCMRAYFCVCDCRQMVTWRTASGIGGQIEPSGPAAWNWPVSTAVLPSLPLSQHTHISTHALTDRSRLCAVSVELWWPLWGSHAGGDKPNTMFHHDMLASLFLRSGEDLVSSFPFCVENEIKPLWAFFQRGSTATRYSIF